MRRLCVVIAYDGTFYAGWQRQQNAVSIQEVLEEAILRQFHESVHVMGSGRTDAGVHALGQVACFDFEHPIPCDKLLLALNANLPEDIRILEVKEVDPSFHPQYGAKRKTYGYRFLNGKIMLPQYRYNTHLVPEPLDIEKIRRALSLLEGEHDFAAFRASGGQNLTTVRKIYEAKLLRIPLAAVPLEMAGDHARATDKEALEEAEAAAFGDDGALYEIRVTGNGFLYNMVRIIAGTMFDIGKGKLPVEVIEEAIATGDREVLGVTAPAKGLTLLNVEYEDRE